MYILTLVGRSGITFCGYQGSLLSLAVPYEKLYVSWPYEIPEDSFLELPSRAGVLNENVWSFGISKHSYPLDESCVERLLIHPDHPDNGPLRRDKVSDQSTGPETDRPVAEEPTFPLKGLKNVYTTFAGEWSLCPGHCFAK